MAYSENSVSPILLRPIREQLEHDRVIRLLVVRLRRRYAVGTNLGDEPEATPVKSLGEDVYPDLVLVTSDSPRRLHGVIEVETAESVNHLEALAEWVPFAKARGAFYLYVPAGTTDVALRLCRQHKIAVSEIWSYHPVGEQMRFTMTYRSGRASAAGRARGARPGKVAAKRDAGTRTGKSAKRAATKKTRAERVAPKKKTVTKKRAATSKKKAPAKKAAAKKAAAKK